MDTLIGNLIFWGFIIFFLMLIKRRFIEPIFGSNLNSEGTDIVTIPFVDDILLLLTAIDSKLMKDIQITFGSSLVILAKK